MSKYKSGYMEFEEASYLSDLFQQIVTDCRVSEEGKIIIFLLANKITLNESYLSW